jgi:hypothetical protein
VQSNGTQAQETFFTGHVHFSRHFPFSRLKAVKQAKPLGSRTKSWGQNVPGRLRQIKTWRIKMKTIRSLMVLAGLSVVFFALSVTGTKAQGLNTTSFTGTFTLPSEAQWGKMTLPAGKYTLHYGQPFNGGVYAVEVFDKAAEISRGMLLPLAISSTSTRKNALVCVREGDVLVVRALEMGDLGTSINFALPHGTRLMAHNGSRNQYAQLAEAPMLIQRVPVTLNAR